MESEKNILSIFKKNNISNGIFVNCNNKTIYTINKNFLGKRTITSKPYQFLDIIKRNNACNYYTFREHIHDIKSLINSVYGMVSIMDYDLESVEASKIDGYDIDMAKDIIKDVNKSVQTLTDFTTNSIKRYEEIYDGYYNLNDLLVYYLPSYINKFLLDSSINKEIGSCYNVVKNILDNIKHIKHKKIDGIILYMVNDAILIKDLNGNSIA